MRLCDKRIERSKTVDEIDRQFTRKGVNFINILWRAFTPADPKSAKKTVKPSVFFVLFGSARAEAAHKVLVKSTPERR